MSEPAALFVLLAPLGQLSGNGQLRETVKERRNRLGQDVSFWYLSPELVNQFNLSDKSLEGVVSSDLTAINWLKLRFGGDSITFPFDLDKLRELATELPSPPPFRDISFN